MEGAHRAEQCSVSAGDAQALAALTRPPSADGRTSKPPKFVSVGSCSRRSRKLSASGVAVTNCSSFSPDQSISKRYIEDAANISTAASVSTTSSAEDLLAPSPVPLFPPLVAPSAQAPMQSTTVRRLKKV